MVPNLKTCFTLNIHYCKFTKVFLQFRKSNTVTISFSSLISEYEIDLRILVVLKYNGLECILIFVLHFKKGAPRSC